MRKTATWTAAIAALLLVPSIAFGLVRLSTDGGFDFDVSETAGGQLLNGTANAYDQMYYLDVDGTRYNSSGMASTMSLMGRQVDMPTQTLSGLEVSRKIYVPEMGGDYVRFLDSLTNPGATDVTVTVSIEGNLGSNSTTNVYATESGDRTLDATDSWFGTDDATDGAGTPSLAHVTMGAGGSAVRLASAPALTGATGDELGWSFDITVPAGETVSLLTFGVQADTQAAAIAEARRLASLPADAVVGLDAHLCDIVNFRASVRFDAPSEVAEGTDVPLTVNVAGCETATPTFSWDTDDDGTFGELADMASYTLPGAMLDGPDTVRVGVQVIDGSLTTEAFAVIEVNNVAPEITSAPRTVAAIRSEYRYEIEVDDPGGANDPLSYTLTDRPTGMTAVGNVLVWTPDAATRGDSFRVVVRVEDDDGGEDVQMFEVTVAENNVPPAPVPVSPIERENVALDEPVTLTVENAVDLDGDLLDYFFRISRQSDFTGDSVIGSGGIAEGEGGTTSWTTPEPLEPGLWYWEVWVDDTIAEGPHRFAQFVVGEGTVMTPDGGVMPPSDAGSIPTPDSGTGGGGGGGCSVGATDQGSPLGLLVAALGLVALVVRRRR
ncbi:MAG: hypothetical protein VYE22_25845 [Myxococcota bacterium]|nr:hypothetical protein [Myxococcota bacterium]